MKTDWKDDIFEGEHRLYSITDAPDGKKYIEDVTSYTQKGDVLSALQMQQIGEEVNRIQSGWMDGDCITLHTNCCSSRDHS